MALFKRVNISITKELHEKALVNSKKLLGKENFSGYLAYLISNDNKIEKQ